jgi:uncharacterized protein with ParB-like and HNH nuclease domain
VLTQVKTTHEIFHQPQRMQVPLFQRRYVWNETEQWSPLLDDLFLVSDQILSDRDPNPHFLGAIVLQQQMHEIDGLPTRIVIDGQQRLTTLQILIHALLDCTTEMGLEDVSLRLQDLVYNPKHYAKNQSDQIKLTPTNQDQHAFQKVLNGESAETDLEKITNNIYAAHAFFKYGFKVWIKAGSESQTKINSSEERAASLASAVSYFLNMVVIDLNMDDDAQLIFETLNARGTPLSPADLIKNAIFQKLALEEDPSMLYEKYWKVLESPFWEVEISSGRLLYPRLSLFINQWLISKIQKEITYRRLFSEFKSYLTVSDSSAEDFLKDINDNARIYEQLHVKAADPTADLSSIELFVYRLNNLESDIFKPILIWLLDPSREVIQAQQIDKFISSLESWMVRRVATKSNTKNYNKFVIEILRKIEKQPRSKVGDFFEDFLAEQTSYLNHWPSDKEVVQVLTTYPLGWRITRARLRVILEALEDSLRGWSGSKPSHEQRMRRYSSTVEHIMPKAWEKNWPAVKDEVARKHRDNIIQTLGNFTLASRRLNSKMSNGPWKEKKKALSDAQLTSLALNKDVFSESEWNETKIEARTSRLLIEFIKYWPVPNEKLPKNFVSPSQDTNTLSEAEFRVGERWTSAEESALAEEWEQGLLISDIAGLHQRRAGGIMARLKTLGLLSEEATQEDSEKIQMAKRSES